MGIGLLEAEAGEGGGLGSDCSRRRRGRVGDWVLRESFQGK
jgi:hypothetical protein